MFSFLKRVLGDKRARHQTEARPAETNKSMNISKKFLEVLTLSFEAKYLREDVKFSKRENKIRALEERLDVLYTNVLHNSTKSRLDDLIALAVAYNNIGQIYATSTKVLELNCGAIALSRCVELLKQNKLDPKAILTIISALNELNSIYAKGEKEHTVTFLNIAMELYTVYTAKDDYPNPVQLAAIFDVREEESNPRFLLDKLHHVTMQDLGVQYLIKPRDKHEFVLYMHNLLKGYLSLMIFERRTFDEENCLDLALTLFDLSKYFLMNCRFVEARNYIATANYVVGRFSEEKFFEDPTVMNEKDAKFNYIHDNCAYIRGISSRFWGGYGVSLLHFWMNKFSQSKEENSCELDISKLEIKSEEKSTKLLIFPDLEEEVKRITDQITYTRILNLSEAKLVFVQTLRHLDTAKKYATDTESYVDITLEISETYKYLAGFEQHKDKQLKLHKRRVECLETAFQKFNKETKDELYLYKRIWYELMISCSTVMDLMLEESYYKMTFYELSVKTDRFAQLISKANNLYLNT